MPKPKPENAAKPVVHVESEYAPDGESAGARGAVAAVGVVAVGVVAACAVLMACLVAAAALAAGVLPLQSAVAAVKDAIAEAAAESEGEGGDNG